MNTLILRFLTVRDSLLGQTSLTTLRKGMVALSILGFACVTGAAQTLMLDDFTAGHYVKSLRDTATPDRNFESLAPGSRLGPYRETTFSVATNPYDLATTLKIGKGFLVLDTCFGCVAAIHVDYGASPTQHVPLGLDVSGYSAFRLNFAGVQTTEQLLVVITVWPQSGGYYNSVVVLPPIGYSFPQDFPFSAFTKGGGGAGLPQDALKDIDFIDIQAQGGGSSSFGLTSFQAVN